MDIDNKGKLPTSMQGAVSRSMPAESTEVKVQTLIS